MALNTIGDLVSFALRVSGVNGIGQTPRAEDSNDGLTMANLILTEWQLSRWFVPDLVEASAPSTGALSYTVGESGAFVLTYGGGGRPDRIDGAFARLIATGADTTLYPFMSREGFDRVALKAGPGPPESYFYDPSAGLTGTIYFSPVPDDTWTLFVKAKASLGQFTGLTSPLTLPPGYTAALLWNLAVALRPVYGLDDLPSVSTRAAEAMLAIGGSGAQQAQAQQVVPSTRSGVYSRVVPIQQQAPPG